jgi:RimJ/RimL family protein N-acetyltransferase
MKPIVFTDPNLFVSLIDRIAKEPIWDDWWKTMLPQMADKCWYFSVESVPGVAILSEIIPRREATWTLILFEPSGKRYKSLVKECQAILNLMMDRCQFERMVTHTSSLNRPAQMIASHIGFHRDGVGRKELHINGVYQDCVHYSIMKNEVNNNGQTKSTVRVRQANTGAGSGTAKPRQLSRSVRNTKSRHVSRSAKRRHEPVFEHGGKHAVGNVRVRWWTKWFPWNR